MAEPSSAILTDGSVEFSGGVDSLKPTTVASKDNPEGLQRNQLAWLVNASVRDGGISPRSGWQPTGKLSDGKTFFQGGFMYEPPAGANPYLICSVGGRILLLDPDNPIVRDLSAQFGLTNPTDIEHAFFEQGEEFLVIQAGDGKTLPLFWDGVKLRRSNGLQPAVAPGSVIGTTVSQPSMIPATGQTTTIAFTSVGSLAAGAVVQLFAHGFAGNPGANQGTYLVTAVASPKITLQRQDQNDSPYNYTAPLDLVLQTSSFTVFPELPAGYAMKYYMQRIWYVFGNQKQYTAGDIVGDTSSGTAAYNFRDSILRVTENPLALGGDGFSIPSNSGTIRALNFPSTIDASLGQGRLLPFTRKQVYSLTVPVTRADWISTNSTNAPQQTVIQINNGAVGDRCIVPVNGDLYYQSVEPAVRSIITASRFFDQPGNIAISNQENRILQFVDRSLLNFATGIEFDSRCLQATLPKRLPQGIVHQAIMPLDFTPVSEFGSNLMPVWEGHWEGLDMLQLFTGDFGGLQRAFAVIVSRTDGTIWVWEITDEGLTDNGDNRITWQVETPAWTFGKEFDLKRLVGAEFWFDRIFGTVEITVEYRADGQTCWNKWTSFKECSSRSCEENIPPVCPPIVYPPQPSQGYGYRNSVSLPKPPVSCDTQMDRPSDIGHQFQLRVTVHGSMRIRGIFIHGVIVDRKLYSKVVC